MKTMHIILLGIAFVIGLALYHEWEAVKRAEAGPAILLRDIDQHAFGGTPRSDLEPYLQRRGGDVAYEVADGLPRASSVDHVIFRNIRHLGETQENLNGEFYYDQGEHLVYYTLKRSWQKPKH